MSAGHRQAGLTLTEMTVVIAVAALLVGLSMPAARMLQNSFETEGGTASMISSALASARAIAAKEQRYAGIRFQKAYSPDGPLNTPQYIIFIINDFNSTTYVNGFRAVEGIEPIKLPDSIGVMNLSLGSTGQDIDRDDRINAPWQVSDATAFSIVFSPSGKLVIHDVRVRNRDGAPRWPVNLDNSQDDVFNTQTKITAPVNPAGMFVQDDYLALGLVEEQSRNSFYIYETQKLKQVAPNLRWTNYLSGLTPVYINPYTGTIVSNK